MAALITEKRRITPRSQAQRRERPKTREEIMFDSLSPIMTIMVRAVRKAGKKMLRDFGEVSSLQVSRKGPGDFVSNADMMAEKTLIEQLSLDKPEYGFITEESERVEPKEGCPYYWVIDPIDGTTNFLHAVPCFSISVALLENEEVIAGVSFNPVTNELYYTEKGKGSFLMTPTGNVRLRVSGRNSLDCSLIGSNGYNSTRNRQAIEKVITKVASVRYNGSTTMALASVAAGQYDAYIATRFKLWDIATGYLLIKEAGGFISDFKGNTALMDIVNSQEMITCNMTLKQTFLDLLKA